MRIFPSVHGMRLRSVVFECAELVSAPFARKEIIFETKLGLENVAYIGMVKKLDFFLKVNIRLSTVHRTRGVCAAYQHYRALQHRRGYHAISALCLGVMCGIFIYG